MMVGRPRRSTHRRFHLFRLRHFLFALVLLLAVFSGPAALLARANSLGRSCLAPIASPAHPGLRFSMVTLSDDGASAGRSFRGVMAATVRSKRAYAATHGYDFAAHGAASVDPRRPPSWSKILAVRARLPRYDWVFWNDADTLVTNPDISLERILHSVIGYNDVNASPDLIVTKDFNGVNAGQNGVRCFSIHGGTSHPLYSLVPQRVEIMQPWSISSITYLLKNCRHMYVCRKCSAFSTPTLGQRHGNHCPV